MREIAKKDIYIAKRISHEMNDYGVEMNVFEKAKSYKFNVQPISGSSDIKVYGEQVHEVQKAIIPYEDFFGVFNVEDIAYLDGNTPDGETVNGENANYRIDAVLNQNKAIAIYFKRRTKKGK